MYVWKKKEEREGKEEQEGRHREGEEKGNQKGILTMRNIFVHEKSISKILYIYQ